MSLIVYKGAKLNVKVETFDLTAKEFNIVKKAVNIIGKAVNSEEFKDFVLNFSWEKKYYTGFWFWKKWHIKRGFEFRWNKNLSNYEVYEKMMSGAEVLDPVEDREIDIYLKIDRRNKKGVVGYMYKGKKWQYTYAWVFRKYDEYGIAGNLLHEWAHHVGFSHERKYNPLREFSVPYALGRYIEGLKNG